MHLQANLTGGDKNVSMPAGKQFAASSWKKLWWGKHWREEWITTVEFPVFEMASTAGGLTPIKEGGGHQTRTLRLLGANGKEYVLRSLDKNLESILPEEFRGTFIHDIINDQISTAHPYSPPVIARLSESLNILHTNPRMVFVPDDPLLGNFRADFANKLFLFEERPSGKGWEKDVLTGKADIIINSEKLLEQLEASPAHQVDQGAYLKVRLLDMLINDWDRHQDQWTWVGKKSESKISYIAFARDRDQSFSKTDGVNLYLLSRPWALRSLQNMDKTVKDVIGINLVATRLDRAFTNQLSKADWEKSITAFQQELTDTTIRASLQALPPVINGLSGDFLYGRLKARRDHMLNYGMKYYRILNKEVTITGTEKAECFIIRDENKKAASVTILAIKDHQVTQDTLFHRVFQHDVTKIINLYALNGNDQFKDERRFHDHILIRAFGGDGNDQFSDSGNIPNRTFIYDTKEDQPLTPGKFRYRATSDTAVTNFHPTGFRYDWWRPLLIPGYNPDDGLVIGAGLTYKKMRWNKDPFSWQQTFVVKYAAATSAVDVNYHGLFKNVFKKWDLEMTANYKAPSFVVNFYGFGNETELVTKERSFYRVKARSILLEPGISRSWSQHYLKADLLFNAVKVEPGYNKFITQPGAGVDSSVFDRKYFGGVGLSYKFNTANNIKYPTKGIVLHAGARYIVNLQETKSDFIQIKGSFTFYLSPLKNVTLAHRTGTGINSGKFEFYQANTIGGAETVRGYWRSRFTGQSSFYQNTDIRWKITDLRGYVFRGAFGIYGFFDDGRVWIKDEHSNTLHTGYGGGIYFIPYSTMAINLAYASSLEVNTFTIRTGFLF
ncbi:BamA/TamA family outer membrane protein [Flavitalea sp.]|nr:BamA/TamA family outer membrane protein [Flavitalea sp.]